MIEIPLSTGDSSPKPGGGGNESALLAKTTAEISEVCTRLINLETKSIIETSSEEEEEKHIETPPPPVIFRSNTQPEMKITPKNEPKPILNDNRVKVQQIQQYHVKFADIYDSRM